MCGLDEWLSPARVQKPAYNPASANIGIMPVLAFLIPRMGRGERLLMLALVVGLIFYLLSRRDR